MSLNRLKNYKFGRQEGQAAIDTSWIFKQKKMDPKSPEQYQGARPDREEILVIKFKV